MKLLLTPPQKREASQAQSEAAAEKSSSLCMPTIRSAASSFALLTEVGTGTFKGRETEWLHWWFDE